MEANIEALQLLSGIGQSINAARTYGTTYSSGGLTFGGGDSNELNRKLIEELLKLQERPAI